VIPAAVVTYHPDSAWPARLDAILREHSPILLVDNSTTPDARAFVAATIANRPSITLHSLPDNPGIGAALNLAFATLAREGHAHAVAYDQDSTPALGFATALAATSAAHPHAAVIGANWSDPRRPDQPARFLRSAGPLGLCFRRTAATTDLSDLLCVITSGSLFDLKTWRDLGGFREDLFLDLIDTDYCLRARRAGLGIVACASAHLLHHRGEKQAVRLFGRDFFPAHAPAARLRCLSRNRMLLFRSHRLRPLAWTAYELAYAVKLLVDALLFETGKISRPNAMARGTWDGLLGRFGPPR